MGKPLRLFSFPDQILRLSAGLVGKSGVVNRLLDSFRLDISKINTRLNWTPPFTLPEGIRKTAHWYLEESRQSIT
jgi:nucleoside-diphosphate-sugar epimerase